MEKTYLIRRSEVSSIGGIGSPTTAKSPTVPSAPAAVSHGVKSLSSGRRRSAAGVCRLRRWLFIAILCCIVCAFVWRTHRLQQRLVDRPWFRDGVEDADRYDEAFRTVDTDAHAVLQYLYATSGSEGVNASVMLGRSDDASTVVTLVIPLRGRLLPLAHITAPHLCRNASSDDDTAFTSVEVIFAASTKFNLSTAMKTLPSASWTSVEVGAVNRRSAASVREPREKVSVELVDMIELRDAASVGTHLASCVQRVAVVRLKSRDNGLQHVFDPLEKMMPKTKQPPPNASAPGDAAVFGFSEEAQKVVPLSQLVTGALLVSNPAASHFVLMSESHFPALISPTRPLRDAAAVTTAVPAGGPSARGPDRSDSTFLGQLMAPFVDHHKHRAHAAPRPVWTSEGDDVVPVASQCTVLQPSGWGHGDPMDAYDRMPPLLAVEDLETDNPHLSAEPQTTASGSASKKDKRKKKNARNRFKSDAAQVAAPPFRLQANAHDRFRFDRLPLLVDAKNLTVVDKGVQSATGVDRQYTTPYCVRRMHGFSATDERVSNVEQVDMVGPYCTAFDRKRYLIVGGLRNDGSAAFANRIFAGMFNHAVRHRILTLVRVRVSFVEKIMEGISLVDVHKAGNILRQQVRLAYAEVVEAANLWEDVTGRKYDRSLNVEHDTFAQSVVESEAALQQEFFESSSGRKVEDRLAWQSARLHDASKELLKLGKNKDSSATEEEVGWDLSLRLQRFDRRWRMVVTSAPALILREWMPREMVSYFNSNRMPALHASYMVDGRFQELWGKALFAMHRSRAGVPSAELNNMNRRELALQERPVTVFWSSFCCGCCGFSSEIVHFIYPLSQRRRVHIFNDEGCFCKGYPTAIHDTLKRLFMLQEHYLIQYRDKNEISVWISHTDPNSYQQVMTDKRKPSYFVGRSMYEFSKIPSSWVKNIEAHCDEVWVPCHFVKHVFLTSGVRPEKLVVIPEAIDTYFFDPRAHHPLQLPLRASKPGWRMWENRPLPRAEDYDASYKFYSNFKWEPRKGWEVLLRAYYDAFAPQHGNASFPRVSLYIQTFFFLNGAVPKGFDIRNATHVVQSIKSWISRTFPVGITLEGSFPHLVIITEHVSEEEEVELYRTMDAFVLPTKGEGWGLPTIQAMSMGLPTISTNWGGNTEFMRRDTSFLIHVDGLEELPEDTFYLYDEGKKWALPSLPHTTALMKHCFEHPDHARAVGRRAREDVHRRFSEEAIADIVDARIERIRELVVQREG